MKSIPPATHCTVHCALFTRPQDVQDCSAVPEEFSPTAFLCSVRVARCSTCVIWGEGGGDPCVLFIYVPLRTIACSVPALHGKAVLTHGGGGGAGTGVCLMAHATCRALPRALRRLVPRFSYFICANATIESLETHPVGAMPPGGRAHHLSLSYELRNRSNLQVRWVKHSVGRWRTAAHPLFRISVAHPQASSCLLSCDRKVPMVL